MSTPFINDVHVCFHLQEDTRIQINILTTWGLPFPWRDTRQTTFKFHAPCHSSEDQILHLFLLPHSLSWPNFEINASLNTHLKNLYLQYLLIDSKSQLSNWTENYIALILTFKGNLFLLNSYPIWLKTIKKIVGAIGSR